MADYIIKKGDLLPKLSAVLKDKAGNPANLTGFSSVSLRFRLRPGGSLQVLSATIDDAVNGVVSRVWSAGDTDTPGVYDAEWRGVGPGGAQQTWPTDGFFQFEIEEIL